jgi:conjugal transfer pilin signal peptidase TrbI
MLKSERQKNIFTVVVSGVIIMGGVMMGLSTRYGVTFNTTESLGFRLFITDKWEKPSHPGEYVKFWLKGNKYFRPEHWTKRIAGVPGDKITVQNRMVYVNGEPVGYAKSVSASNTQYFPIAPQVIPPHYYYLQADHEDSYDSRYQSFGLVHDTTFIGRDYPVFLRDGRS